MVKKILGYVLCGAGLIGLAASAIKEIREKIPLPETITKTTLMIISVALVVVGIFFLMKKTEKISAEVPIYKGKQIVGYRRH